VEIVELRDHPWFVATQFHPEFRSRPDRPHPLFDGFIGTAVALREGREPRLRVRTAPHREAVGPGGPGAGAATGTGASGTGELDLSSAEG
jgi:hypothetical protein